MKHRGKNAKTLSNAFFSWVSSEKKKEKKIKKNFLAHAEGAREVMLGTVKKKKRPRVFFFNPKTPLASILNFQLGDGPREIVGHDVIPLLSFRSQFLTQLGLNLRFFTLPLATK